MSHPRIISAPGNRRLAAITALLLAGGGVLALAPPASAAIVPGNALAIATALAGPGANVTGASYPNVANSLQNGVGNSTLSSFPWLLSR